MQQPPVQPPAYVLRAATLPLSTRVAVVLTFTALYLLLFFFAGGPTGAALRPLNLVHVVVGGLLFGFRGGIVVGLLAAAGNVLLYRAFGVFGEGTVAAGNLLSVAAGIGAGALVGRIRDLSLALREEMDRRKSAERRKDELTALLVHDLKNPLAGVVGHAQLVTTVPLTEAERNESLLTILDSAEDMRRMLLNLLDIGRAEDGELRPRFQDVDLRELVSEVQDALVRPLQGRRIEVEVKGAPEHAHVQADRDLLKRLLLNLVDNAIKYTPAQKLLRIEVDASPTGVELAVRDEGPGIPQGFEQAIFEKYARLERDALIAAHISRGLGLHFCRLAAQTHGGRIWVEPSKPTGSVFRVQLPRQQLPLEAAPRPRLAAQA